jgi:hypothetical protein
MVDRRRWTAEEFGRYFAGHPLICSDTRKHSFRPTNHHLEARGQRPAWGARIRSGTEAPKRTASDIRCKAAQRCEIVVYDLYNQ